MSRSKDLDTIAPDDPIIVSHKKSSRRQPVPVKSTSFSFKTLPDNKIYDILGHTQNSLSSFLVKPKILSFREQDEGEQIYLAIRSHWITNIHWIVTFILMMFVPLFFKYLNFLDFLPFNYRLVLLLFWYLITFIYAFEGFLSWYFDLFIITNHRVIDIDFNNLLNRHFAEADLSAIQDTSSSIKGILATFFNFGDVLIQTAGETNQINFEKIANPEKVIKLLKELRDLYGGKHA
jgi:hypothetical protein